MVHRCGRKPSGEEVSISLSYALRTTDRLTGLSGKVDEEVGLKRGILVSLWKMIRAVNEKWCL